jgi:hypothetical protein
MFRKLQGVRKCSLKTKCSAQRMAKEEHAKTFCFWHMTHRHFPLPERDLYREPPVSLLEQPTSKIKSPAAGAPLAS